MDLSDELAMIEVCFQWLGWVSRSDRNGSVSWEILEPREVWLQFSDAVQTTKGVEAAKELAKSAQEQPKERRFSWLLDQLSDNGIRTLSFQLEKLRAAAGVPHFKQEELTEDQIKWD